MLGLTRQEQKVICVVLLLLLVGWTVKAWRAAHPGAGAEAGAEERSTAPVSSGPGEAER